MFQVYMTNRTAWMLILPSNPEKVTQMLVGKILSQTLQIYNFYFR